MGGFPLNYHRDAHADIIEIDPVSFAHLKAHLATECRAAPRGLQTGLGERDLPSQRTQIDEAVAAAQLSRRVKGRTNLWETWGGAGGQRGEALTCWEGGDPGPFLRIWMAHVHVLNNASRSLGFS